MNKLPCELIQDLLPSYVDGLTNEVTNKLVSEHINSCADCDKKYRQMKNPLASEDDERDAKEIDFLKTTKKKSRKTIIIATAVIWFVAVLVVCLRLGFSGSYMNTDFLSYNLNVSGTNMQLSVTSTGNAGLQLVDVNESEGVVEVSVRGVPSSLFYKKTKDLSFCASQEIKQIWIGDRIIWANGKQISPLTSNLYAVYNPYIGNMPANGDIVSVLNMTAYMGNFKNELQTSKEPYSWKLLLQNDFSGNREEAFEERLTKYAYILLAEVGNLNEVIYEYSIDGKPKSLSVTAADATAFAGNDIKEVGISINLLEQLVEKTELSNIMFSDGPVEINEQVDYSMSDQTEEVIEIVVINYSSDKVYGLSAELDCDSTVGRQSMSNADGSPLKDGENIKFQLIPEDFSEIFENGTTGSITIYVKDKDGNTTKAHGDIEIDANWGYTYKVNLSGDANSGYLMGK